MTDKLAVEPYPGYQAQRISHALSYLSMDSIAPFFPLIEVGGIPRVGQFQNEIRNLIVEYRKRAETEAPALLGFSLDHLERAMGKEVATRFLYWYKYVFVKSAEDYRDFSRWQDSLYSIFRDRTFIGDAYGLPPELAGTIKEKFLADLSLDDFNEVGDRVDETPLSEWDKEMYARHEYYEEMKDPEIPIQLTCRQLRYRRFIAWLLEQLDPTEVEAFQSKVRGIEQDPEVESSYTLFANLPDLSTQVLPDADDL